MKSVEEQYAAFEQAMDNDEIWRDSELSFDNICEKLGANSSVIGKMLVQELGFTGQEILDRYRVLGSKSSE